MSLASAPRIGAFNHGSIIPMLGRDFPLPRKIAEIIKNSNDEYARLADQGIFRDDLERIVLCMVDGDNMVIIDAGGMASSDIVGWAEFGVESEEDDPSESEQGIGAKASMRLLASEAAYLLSVKDGRFNKAGFLFDGDREDLQVLPDWVHAPSCSCGGSAYKPLGANDAANQVSNQHGSVNRSGVWEWNCDGEVLYDQPIDNPVAKLIEQLRVCGIDLESEWEGQEDYLNEIREAFLHAVQQRGGWTIVHIKGLEQKMGIGGHRRTRKLMELCEKLPSEPQIRRTLEESTVVFVQGRYATHLQLFYPKQLDGLDPVEIEVPGPLVDPDTGIKFELKEHLYLQLNASDVALNTSRLRGLRGIRVNDGRNTVWTHPVDEGIDHAAAHRIFGTAVVPVSGGLSEYATTAREVEPEHPICGAINAAIDEHIQAYTEKVAEILGSRSRESHDSEQLQDEIDDMMDALEELIDLDAMFENGTSSGGEKLAHSATDFYLESMKSPLTNVNMVMGASHRLNVIARGRSPLDNSLLKLSELMGLRGVEREPFFTITSSDEKVVTVRSNFTIHAASKGTATITVKPSVLLTSNTRTPPEASVEISVIEIDVPPTVVLNPTPGPRGQSNIAIDVEGTDADGNDITGQNTIFDMAVTGPGSLNNAIPKTLSTTQVIGKGVVSVIWSVGKQVDAPFETTKELHIPSKRDRDGDGGVRKRQFPRLILCGNRPYTTEQLEAMGKVDPENDTILPSADDATLVYNPIWSNEPYNIVWLNPLSKEAQMKLAGHGNRKGVVSTNTQTYRRWRRDAVAEVAVRQVMKVEITEGHSPMPTVIDDVWVVRNSAEARMSDFYEAIINGELDGGLDD